MSDEKNPLEKNGIALVLGAGVSAGSGLPDWRELLVRLVAVCHGFDQQEAVCWVADQLHPDVGLSEPAIAGLLEDRVRLNEGLPPAVARNVEAHPPELRFPWVVRECLYRDFGDRRGKTGKTGYWQPTEAIRRTNPTLAAIAAACVIKAANGRYEANPWIRAVVTFNIDDILQRYTRARYRSRLLRTVERSSASARHGRTSVYHMHGMVRSDGDWDDPTKGAPDSLVLTEQQYFDLFDQPTSMFNYTFLHVLREYSCIFIGLSMRDNNLRRLLHYSYRERVEDLRKETVLKRSRGGKNVQGDTPTDEEVRKRARRHLAIRKRPPSGDGGERVVEESLGSLGVRARWVDEHSQIPEQIGEIYGSMRAIDGSGSTLRWQDVYDLRPGQ